MGRKRKPKMDKDDASVWRQGVRDALAEARTELQKSEDTMEASIDFKDYKAASTWQTRVEALKSLITRLEQLLANPNPSLPTETE